MLQVESFRETRVFQEALGEGMEKGMAIGMEIGLKKAMEKRIKDVALRMLAEKFPVQKIADLTGLSVAAVKQLKKKRK